VYSNTGGQASKSTPMGSIARFAEAGKTTNKKDLGMMMMSYGYVYVAAIAMGANKNQALQAIKEAEEYPGPAIGIAYAPCINHGIDMSMSQKHEKAAVDAGYWLLYRYNPQRKLEGKNPLILDSKEPSMSVADFIKTERRYSGLHRIFPERAEHLKSVPQFSSRNATSNTRNLANNQYTKYHKGDAKCGVPFFAGANLCF
jgi:pyruvate-ferredoxin/flavodoxin oxidoreductase